MNPFRLFFLIILVVGLSSCASTGGSGDSSGRNARDQITLDDIQNSPATYNNAYQIVERFHPEWLRKRSGRIVDNETHELMEGDIVVYSNDVRMGGTDTLKNIPSESVLSIQFLDAARATRYGTGHQHGVILVKTR